jgi:hypothetical protein
MSYNTGINNQVVSNWAIMPPMNKTIPIFVGICPDAPYNITYNINKNIYPENNK